MAELKMSAAARGVRQKAETLHAKLDGALAPGDLTTKVVAVALTKEELALMLALIDGFLL